LENVVYLELLRRGYKIWVGALRNGEVDFVAKNNIGDIEYYQVAWEISAEKTEKREFAFEKIKDNYPKFLLTTESFPQSKDGVKHINVFNWLLGL
jgi:predicted AAA+ superfamily ATPase